jgi:hypothetical protein
VQVIDRSFAAGVNEIRPALQTSSIQAVRDCANGSGFLDFGKGDEG